MTAMTLATAARVEAHLGILADRIEEEALLSHVVPSEEIAEAIGQGNAVRRHAFLAPWSGVLMLPLRSYFAGEA